MAHNIYAYTFYAAIYCAQCGGTLPEIDQEGNAKTPIYSWELGELYEFDSYGEAIPPSCDKCREVID